MQKTLLFSSEYILSGIFYALARPWGREPAALIASHLSGFLGEQNSSSTPGADVEVSASKCEDCGYVGPIVIETDAQRSFAGHFVSFWDRLEEGSFWSETGIANHTLFQT